jgi:hypothetical protein
MRKFLSWQIKFALGLILLSATFYWLHYAIFKDFHHIFLYLIGDIAFLFLDVLIVMLVLQRVLEMRDKRSVMNKLNMVIGTFFNEVGTELLDKCSHFDPGLAKVGGNLLIKSDWTDTNFLKARRFMLAHESLISSKNGDLPGLKEFLAQKRQFLLNLLENANLLEHETFTNLLWAVFHLADELEHRSSFSGLPEKDYEHLSGDMKRAYQQLIIQWLDYMQHLKRAYPYLFSLAVRTNPFDINASVILGR